MSEVEHDDQDDQSRDLPSMAKKIKPKIPVCIRWF